MIIAMVLAGVAVLVAVVRLAMGKGGELAEVHPDYPPLALPESRPIVGTDAALLKLPRGLWGYQIEITDEALQRLAFSLTERDTRIATLEHRITELRAELAAAGRSDRPAGPAGFGGPESAPDQAPAPVQPSQGRDHETAGEPHPAGPENGKGAWAPLDASYPSGSELREQAVWTPRSAYEPSAFPAPAPAAVPEPPPAPPYPAPPSSSPVSSTSSAPLAPSEPVSPYERFSGWWEQQGNAQADARAEGEEEILDSRDPVGGPAGGRRNGHDANLDDETHADDIRGDEARGEEARGDNGRGGGGRDDRAWLDGGAGDDGIGGRTTRESK